MNFQEFQSLMKSRKVNLPPLVHKVVKHTATRYLGTVAELTPVDTGRAVSNWQVGINATQTGPIEAHSPGKYRSTDKANLTATMQAGLGVIESSAPGTALHISNNLSYIVDLDQGSSSQAPSGMTASAALAARQGLTRTKVVLPK